MRPYLLQGHERPLTQLKYNREGDLLFSCAKDSKATLWSAEDGARIGTYEGHKGAIYTCDISRDSGVLITASADWSARLWEVETGAPLFTFSFQGPCRAVAFNQGETLAAISTDKFQTQQPAIHLVPIERDPAQQTSTVLRKLEGFGGRLTRAAFTDLNRTLLTASEDGCVRRWDVETGEVTEEKRLHTEIIQDMQLHRDGSHLVTASTDMTCKLVDTQTLETLKTYNTDRPCNCAALSPIFDHVVVGGGQEAAKVTTTSARAGKFESFFYHKIFTDEIGSVRGHFGPVNAITFSPDGAAFVTGGEDGYIRLQKFDRDYWQISKKFVNESLKV